MPRLRLTTLSVLSLAGVLLGSPLAFAQIIGADPAACQDSSSVCSHHLQTYSFISLTEGNVAETYSTARVTSAFGPTLMFNLIYNSYNADGNRAAIDTGIGLGWTHTYNDFLFTQGGNDMFRWRGDGRVTKYTYSNGSYQTAPGYFETLETDNNGSFAIVTKHQTVYRYEPVVGRRSIAGHSSIDPTIYRLVSITDRNHNVTNFTYSNSKLVSITDTYGRSLALTYNGNNHLSSVTDPLGRVTTFTYDASGTELIQITDPLGKNTNYSYNNLNQVISQTDRDGRTFNLTYQDNLPYSETDANGGTIYALTNNSNWATDQNQLDQYYLRVYIPSTTLRTDGNGNVWQYKYDSNGFPLTITAPDGATTTYTYDPNVLEVASRTDANGNTTSYQYDSEGNLVQVTDANGNATKFTYEPQFNLMTSMTDANGRTTTYSYDDHGNRISETDPLSQTAQWTYDSHGNVLTFTDKRGNTTTYAYDANGNRVKVADALNEVTQYAYDAVGNRTSMTDPNGHLTTDKYDALNRLILQTDALGGTMKTSYDGESDRTQMIDQDGNATSYSYDLRRRATSITDALGKSTTFTYDGNDKRVSMTDRNGHKTTYAYDVQDRLIATTDALGDVSSMTYDGVGNVLTATDANNNTTTYQYDKLNRKTQMSDALNEVTMWGYDLSGLPGCPQCTGPTFGSGKITKQTDCNGKVIYWAYDGLDRLIIEIDKQGSTDYVIGPNDAVTRNGYDENSNRVSMTDAVNDTTTYSYDAVNRQTQMVNAAGDTWTNTYDPKGNTKTATYPNLNLVTNTYDALDRLVQMDDEIGRVANYTYDAAGNQLSQRDGSGNGTYNTYDADYRVIRVFDALKQPTNFTYDAAGNLLTTRDRQGNVTSNAYDNIDRLASTTNPLGSVTQYTYDKVSNIAGITDGNGNAIHYVYDPVNRRTEDFYADGTYTYYIYDCTGHLISEKDQNGFTTLYHYSDLYFLLQRAYETSPNDNFTYDLLGRMLTAEKGGWVDSFSWDGRNYLTQSIQNGQGVAYNYDIPERFREVYYPNGELIEELSDARGRLGKVAVVLPLELDVALYSYDAGNRVISRTYPNAGGSTSVPTYNANDWVTNLNSTVNSSRIVGFNYSYDHEGDKLFEQKLPDSTPARSEVYAYNGIYQMTDFNWVTASKAAARAFPVHHTHYGLDNVGNWTSKTTDGIQQTRQHNDVNEITSIDNAPLSYDQNGNLTDDPQYHYDYDQKNNLINVSTVSQQPTPLVQFRQDALGRLVEEDGSPSATRFFYDGQRMIALQDVVGNEKAAYAYGNGLDEVLEELLTGHFYFQNALGSVVAVTDGTGKALERYTYDAYGAPNITNGMDEAVSPNKSGPAHSAIGNPWMFTGRYYDEPTGLYYYRARNFDTGKGRFLQRDPIGIWGDPVNLGNGYAYVGNSPTGATDPTGLEGCCKGTHLKETLACRKAGKQQNELFACATGEHIPKVVLVCRKAGKDQQEYRKAGKDQQEYEITLSDTLISSYHTSGSGGAESRFVKKVDKAGPKLIRAWDSGDWGGMLSGRFGPAALNGTKQKPDGTAGGTTKRVIQTTGRASAFTIQTTGGTLAAGPFALDYAEQKPDGTLGGTTKNDGSELIWHGDGYVCFCDYDSPADCGRASDWTCYEESRYWSGHIW